MELLTNLFTFKHRSIDIEIDFILILILKFNIYKIKIFKFDKCKHFVY